MQINATVYEWDAWDGYLLCQVLPGAHRIHATAFDSSNEIIDKTSPGTTHFVFHIDCTNRSRFPNDRGLLLDRLEERKIHPLNGRLVDSSKRWIQDTCRSLGLRTTAAEIGGDPHQRVIVKTNMNYGGMRERRLLPAERRNLGIDVPAEVIDGPLAYPIMTTSEIPAEWWSNPSLCIERYIDNSAGTWLRGYVFLQRMTIAELASGDPIKKLDNSHTQNTYRATAIDGRLKTEQSTPDLIRNALSDLSQFGAASGFEFGAIDMVCSDSGECFIIDVNPTPIWKPNLIEVASYLES